MTTRLAYVAGLVIAPVIALCAMWALNERGPEQCHERRDVLAEGRLVEVRQCVGALGLTTSAQIVVRIH